MALLDKDARNVLIGIGVGVGFAALFPGVAPILKDAGRPLAKASIKRGITVFEKNRETFSRWAEVLEDLIAEARSDLDLEARQTAAAAADQAAKTNGGA